MKISDLTKTPIHYTLIVGAYFLWGAVTMLLWEWFIVPLGAPSITLLHGCGLILSAKYVTQRIGDYNSTLGPRREMELAKRSLRDELRAGLGERLPGHEVSPEELDAVVDKSMKVRERIFDLAKAYLPPLCALLLGTVFHLLMVWTS